MTELDEAVEFVKTKVGKLLGHADPCAYFSLHPGTRFFIVINDTQARNRLINEIPPNGLTVIQYVFKRYDIYALNAYSGIIRVRTESDKALANELVFRIASRGY